MGCISFRVLLREDDCQYPEQYSLGLLGDMPAVFFKSGRHTKHAGDEHKKRRW